MVSRPEPGGCELCGHLATALLAHHDWALRVLGSVPDDINVLADIFVRSARDRHGPTSLEALFAERDRQVVPRKLLDLDAAAQATSLSRRTVERKIAAGELRAVKVDGRTLIRVADLDAFIDSLPSTGTAA